METTFKSMLQNQVPHTNTQTLSTFGRHQDLLAAATIWQDQDIGPHEDISFVIKHGQSYLSHTINSCLIVSDCLQTSLAAWAVAHPITFGNYALTILSTTVFQKRNFLTIC
jgi:hypothetical protein